MCGPLLMLILLHMLYRDDKGNQMVFENYVLLAIESVNRENLKFINPDGTSIEIGKSGDWKPIPGSAIDGLLYRVPEVQGQSAITHDDIEVKWMALIFGKSDRETYGNAIGLRLADHNSNNQVNAIVTSFNSPS